MPNGVKLDSRPGWLGAGQDASVPGWLGAGQDASVVSGGAVGPRTSVIGSLTSMIHLGGGSPQTSIENHIEIQDDLR